jgi:hypothetical protein
VIVNKVAVADARRVMIRVPLRWKFLLPFFLRESLVPTVGGANAAGTCDNKFAGMARLGKKFCFPGKVKEL